MYNKFCKGFHCMKKLGLFVMPLMAVSLLVNCNNGGGTPVVTYTINPPKIFNGTLLGDVPTTINSNETVQFTFKANDECSLPSDVNVNGANHTFTTSGEQGIVTLSNPVSDVTISIYCTSPKKTYNYL